MRLTDRRTLRGWKLRTYIDALKDAQSMTDAQWMEAWVASCTADSVYIPRTTWIAILQTWALHEAEILTDFDVAA